MASQTHHTFRRCGIIDPLDLAEYERHGALAGLRRALGLAPGAVVDKLVRSGLRGRGGAGFPTGHKWKTAAEAPGERRYIVANADEGDSGTFADRVLTEDDPFCLLEGMAIAAATTGATKGFVCLRSEYPVAIEVMTHAITAATLGGLIGPSILGTGRRFEVELRVGAGAYVRGEETSLLDSLEGKRGQVRAKPPLPARKGLFGCPTVVNNVVTLASMPEILRAGAEAYQSLGVGRSRGTTPLQIAGNVRYGGLYEAPFGLTLGEIVERIGGGTASGRPVRAVHVDGPLGAYFRRELFDTIFDYEAFSARDGLIGHAGIVVFDDTVDTSRQARFAFEFCAVESCGKCTPCRIGAKRGLETMDKVIAGVEPKRNLALVEDLCNTMKFGSLCALGGSTPYPVMSALMHFPEDFMPASLRQAAE